MSVFDCTQVGEVHKRICNCGGATGALFTGYGPHVERFAQFRGHGCECTVARMIGSPIAPVNARSGAMWAGVFAW